jgi:pimeloyl-ACP methyl ester carboxylesterase
METITERHRLIVVDRRGHGTSPVDPRPYTIAGDATDVLEAVDLRDVAAFHLVGHSYGGLVALEVARRAPERILSLHLIEPPYLSLLPDDPDVALLIERGRAILDHAEAWGAERTAAEFFAMLLGPIALADLQARPSWSAVVREAARSAYEEFPADYPPTALGEVRPTAPVHLYTGGRSNRGLQKLARTLAEAIPGARLVEEPAATHAVQSFPRLNEDLLAVIHRAAGETFPAP